MANISQNSLIVSQKYRGRAVEIGCEIQEREQIAMVLKKLKAKQ